MTGQLDAALRKEFAEAKAAVARHGVVIVRAVDEDLVPTIMAAVRNSLSASSRKLSNLSEKELDRLVNDVRKAADKEALDLRDLYVRVLAEVGRQEPEELTKTIDGVLELFGWERIARTSERASEMLVKSGFEPLHLVGPAEVSESFGIELVEKLPTAIQRLSDLAAAMAERPAQERPGAEKDDKGAGARPGKKRGRARKR